MTFRDSARDAALKAASDLSLLSDQIGILRSVDATESARWLKEIAERLREACDDEPRQVASPPGEAGGGLCAEAARIPGVDAVYLRPDGLEFVMTGSDPSPDMYEACADVAVRLHIEGRWSRDQSPIEDWLVVYVRAGKP